MLLEAWVGRYHACSLVCLMSRMCPDGSLMAMTVVLGRLAVYRRSMGYLLPPLGSTVPRLAPTSSETLDRTTQDPPHMHLLHHAWLPASDPHAPLRHQIKQPPSVLAPNLPRLLTCPRRLLPTILRGQLFCSLTLTSYSPSTSHPACQPADLPLRDNSSPQHSQSWRRQFSAPRSDPRRVESIRLTPVTWPNEIAFELRNLETAPPIRPSVRPATPALSAVQVPHAQGFATIRPTHRLPRASRRCSWRRTACWVTASTLSRPPALSWPLSSCLLSCRSCAAQTWRPSCAAPAFLHQRRQPSPDPERWRTPHAIGATVRGIFFTDYLPTQDPFEGPSPPPGCQLPRLWDLANL